MNDQMNSLQAQMLELEHLQSYTAGDQMCIAGGAKNVMLGLKAKSRDFWQVPVEELVYLEDFNSRIHDADYHARVRMLADVMKQEGFNPEFPLGGVIINEGGKKVLRIHAGYRRGAAILLANKELREEGAPEDRLILNVPVVVRPEGTSIIDLTVDLVVGNSGDKLKPIEVAAVCKRLSRQGLTNTQISERCQLGGASYVEGLLMLIGGPQAIREMVVAGTISATHAIDVLRTHGDKACEMLQAAQGRAEAAGKTKVTKRFMPGALRNKLVSKASPVMRTAIDAVKVDPGFQNLMPETVTLLEQALELLKQADEREAQMASAAEQAAEQGEEKNTAENEA